MGGREGNEESNASEAIRLKSCGTSYFAWTDKAGKTKVMTGKTGR